MFRDKQRKAVHTALRRRLSKNEPPVEITAHRLTITAQLLGRSDDHDAENPGSKRDIGLYLERNRDLGFVEIEKGERNIAGRRVWILHPTEQYEGGDR